MCAVAVGYISRVQQGAVGIVEQLHLCFGTFPFYFDNIVDNSITVFRDIDVLNVIAS